MMKNKLLIVIFIILAFCCLAFSVSAEEVVDTNISSEQQAIIDDFKASTAFQDIIKAAEDAAYEEGKKQGYSEAEINVYKKGLTDGYINYKQTKEYEGTLTLRYKEGYLAGYDEGVKDAEAAAFNPASIIAIIITIVALFILYIFISERRSKKKGKK